MATAVVRCTSKAAGADGIERAFNVLNAEILRYANDAPNKKPSDEVLKDLDILEKLLKKAEQYGTYASKFCLLELDALTEIAKKSTSSMKGRIKDGALIDFIASLNEEQYKELRDKCASGIRVKSVVYGTKRMCEIRDKQTRCISVSNDIVNDFRKNGTAQLSTEVFYGELIDHAKETSFIVNASVRETRARILKSGAVGIKDGSGTYIRAGDKRTGEAIANRLTEIKQDVLSIVRICSNAPEFARDGMFSEVSLVIETANETIGQLATCYQGASLLNDGGGE